jgi:hypothetical protein
MKAITTTIRETIKGSNGKGERKDIGKIAFLVPTLEEVKDHLNTETAFVMEKEGEKELDTYESNFSQFLADAIEAACKSSSLPSSNRKALLSSLDNLSGQRLLNWSKLLRREDSTLPLLRHSRLLLLPLSPA